MSDYEDDDFGMDGEDPMGSTDGRKATWRAPIFNLANALGGVEDFFNQVTEETERVYRLGDECLACLRDLRRWWNEFGQDDDDRVVARLFHECGLFSNDLLPILQISVESGPKGFKTAIACINLMLLMTWPINVAEELRDAQLMDEDLSKVDYAGLQAIQRTYKTAAVRNHAVKHIFAVLVQVLEKKKERDSFDRERAEKNDNLISMILHLIRNLLSIQDKPSSSYQSMEAVEQASLQSELLVQMQQCELFDFLLMAASLTNTRDWSTFNLILLDIFHLSFRLAKPEELAKDLRVVRNSQLTDMLDSESRLKRAETRKAASRHNRFGTTVSLNNGDRRYVMHKQAAVFKSPTKVMDNVKKGAKKKNRADDELAPPLGLTADAIRALRAVGLGFLENSANMFFYSVLRDLAKDQAKELDNVRYFILVAFFLDLFLLVQEDEREREVDHASEAGHDFDLIAELTDEDAVKRIVVRMRQSGEEKPVNTIELHATIRALTATMRCVEALTQSPQEEYKDTGNLLQHKLYYDPEWLELILDVVSKCKDQSRKYIESAVELTHVILRMLEEYSKTNKFVVIKKTRKNAAASKRARAKAKGKRGAEEDEGIQDHVSDEETAEYEAEQEAVDRATHHFQFSSFEQKFATEGVLRTLMSYLSRYKTFAFEYQIKHVVKLLHRQAVKAKAVGLFFKASVLNLFRDILDDRKSLPKTQSWNDLFSLIQYVLKAFFKAAREQPMLLIETFFPRTKGQINKMIKTNEKAAALEVDLDHDDGTALTPLDGDVRGGRGRGRGKGKRRGTRRTRREAPGDESRSESEPDEAALRRRKRKEEQLAAIKSAQFVESDEDATDDERDRVFFTKEQERKRRRDELVEAGVPLDHQASDAPTKTKKQKRKAVPKGRKTGQGGDGDATKDHTAPEAVNESWQEQEVTDEPSGEGVDRGRGEAPPSSPAVLPSRKRAVVADSEEE